MNKNVRGRGASLNPQHRFESLQLVYHEPGSGQGPPTRIYEDNTGEVLSRNESPDVGFDFSLNPYRGCEHGCAYCFSRPNHEYLELSAGLDFETVLFAKLDAAELLRKRLCSRSWQPQVIALSGATDPYQPAERELGITRQCLKVVGRARNPVALITKSKLILRDFDLLKELARHNAVSVSISLTSLDATLARRMEPRAASPTARLEVIREIREAGIPVRALIAPVIPGLTDEELPALLQAAADAGASHAGYIALRLPHGVKEIFSDWLERHYPLRRERVLRRVRAMRGGQLYKSRFGERMTGTGPHAELIARTFATFARKFGLETDPIPLNTSDFARPTDQATLF